MLDKIIMLPFSIFLICLFIFAGCIGSIMFGQWCMVQNVSQNVAASMGKWGGYTEQTDELVDNFAQDLGVQRSEIDVEVSNTTPVAWGENVSAKLSVPFKFKLGNYNFGTYELMGVGRSVSTYLEGAYDVNYTKP